jgi:hypothetical protein
MNCYSFVGNPCGINYQALIQFCCQNAAEMTLVVRDPNLSLPAELQHSIAELRAECINVIRTDRWPGTILYEAEADLWRYRVNGDLCAKICRRECLYDWLHPRAPEDPCFFRKDGSELLVTISHEADAYLQLTEAEHRSLVVAFPDLDRLLRREEESDDDLRR